MATEGHEAKTSQKPTEYSLTFATVLTGWMRAWSRMYQTTLHPEDPELYARLLSSLTVIQLNAACEIVSKTFKPTAACAFPTPSHILDCVDKTAALASQLEAENAWDRATRLIWIHYTPDLPAQGMAKIDFADKVAHCLRAAGGFGVIANCTLNDLHFRKADFMAAWETYTTLDENQALLPDSQAKHLLRETAQRLKEGGQ